MSVAEVLSSPASPLLDPADSLLRARALRSWSGAQQDAVRQRLAAVHRDWHSEWIRESASDAANDPVDVRLSALDDAPGQPGVQAASWWFDQPPRRTAPNEPMTSGGLGATQDAIRAVAQQMFSFDIMAALRSGQEAARMAPALAKAAWSGWLDELQGLFGGLALSCEAGPGERTAHALADPWSGALRASWSWCGGTWHLHLSHEAVAAVLGREQAASPVVSETSSSTPNSKHALDHVLADRQVALRVMLDGAQLSLGQVQSLRVGDIVTVRHALESPAHVTDMQGTRLCDGWLGQSGAHVAVELALSVAAITTARPLPQQSKENNS